MDIIEEDYKNKSLPYCANKENIDKLLNAIKHKEGNEDSIKAVFGKGKYLEVKRSMLTFNVITEDMKLTDLGRRIIYSNENEVNKCWYEIITNYKPYEEFIQYFKVNNKSNTSEVDAEEIKKFWGRCSYGSSENNRSDAVPTFGSIVELAGIGEYKIGRRKQPSRIIFELKALDTDSVKITENQEKQETEEITSINSSENQEINNEEIFDDESEKQYYTISIPTQSGKAKIIIPSDASKEDAELIKDMMDVIFKRKFGI